MRAWLPRRRPSPATVMSAAALFIALGGAGYAATGGSFILGQGNFASKTSGLTSAVTTGPTLALKNSGGEPAANFNVAGGVSPFSVSNSTRIPRLNADKLDGLDASALLPGGVLPAGVTIRGAYTLGARSSLGDERAFGAISFGYTLASAPTAHFIGVFDTPPPQCGGTISLPAPAPGNLCIYETVNQNAGGIVVSGAMGDASTWRFGAGLELFPADGASGLFRSAGSWAVTSG